MDAESLTDLALRVLAREATQEDRRALEMALASNPAFRQEFEGLKAAHDVLRAAAPLTEALAAKEPELPAHRLNELRTAVRQHFGPAAQRDSSRNKSGALFPGLRWLWAGGATVLALAVILMSFADRSVEVGLYRTDLVRGGEKPLSPTDLPSAHVVTFDQDDSFDQWTKTLSWNQHAKIWIDNESDLLHIVRRDKEGHLVERTEPLARTDKEQRDQINRIVTSLQKR